METSSLLDNYARLLHQSPTWVLHLKMGTLWHLFTLSDRPHAALVHELLADLNVS